MGARAIITKSFARIHETNLKKQGLLPLTFVNPADYDRISGDDRVSLIGLQNLAPGSGLTLRVKSAKTGQTVDVKLKHTLNEGQIVWFKKGSALNAMKEALTNKH